eukprot:gnl/MRDRNA2_/MRDRNA2_55044_c0_seq1.p1 gnl/MRDRNA2_/MRDRNA2_55044_c0~~gnl/MRDRNA2_/MRDRNA2_55044_c0_seq1.p1  ORF type:complete len:302 (-),score=55.59 gnl/MRDRNA2_/MRDRNA2_55044_c0_seq1:57-962(-)
MSRNAEVQELVPAELSTFERRCLQEAESVSIEIPRGLRVASTARVAGRRQNAPSRTYSLTVEPKGRMKKAKDLLRETSKPLTDLEYDLQQTAMGKKEVEGLLNERFCYRNQRVKKFNLTSHFPALVSPRIVPSYRMQQAGSQIGTPRDDSTLHSDTVSTQRKHRSKRPKDPLQPFIPSTRNAERAICDRQPALFDTPYESSRAAQLQEYADHKDRWQGPGTMLPTNIARTQATCEPNRQEKDEHITRMREKGKEQQRALEEQYFVKLKAFQEEWRSFSPMPVLKQIAADEVFNMGGHRAIA